MNALVLRGAAAVVTAGSFIGATGYVVAHPKNPAAPLQPPAAEFIAPPTARPTTTPTATTSGATRGSARPTATIKPVPKITLQPAVRATALPGITYTHTS